MPRPWIFFDFARGSGYSGRPHSYSVSFCTTFITDLPREAEACREARRLFEPMLLPERYVTEPVWFNFATDTVFCWFDEVERFWKDDLYKKIQNLALTIRSGDTEYCFENVLLGFGPFEPIHYLAQFTSLKNITFNVIETELTCDTWEPGAKWNHWLEEWFHAYHIKRDFYCLNESSPFNIYIVCQSAPTEEWVTPETCHRVYETLMKKKAAFMEAEERHLLARK
ncbi:hypothetical protein VHEMI01956 [[Torrubiella] hemipterigena]|uniref:Uncharacterized protein n=1 Tax=[Torrubiella] hemipterigena TaxID=1531966 RepID=A0A0A1T6B4_9HYPO|nr:hypothetical protein VHEMI01956 [[Torrubiella] hemipterigena]